MATNHLSKEMTALQNGTPIPTSTANAMNARIKRFRCTFDLAAQASGDTLELVTMLPKGYVFLAALVTTSVTLGTATLSIGESHIDPTTGNKVVNAAKYSAARAITSVETPILLGATGASVERKFDETIIATVGTAALPASGTLVIDLLCSSVA